MTSGTKNITLTNRRPVQIVEAEWTVVASAYRRDFDSEHEFQANRTSTWNIKVRRHDDGRALVSAVYTFSSHFMSEPDYDTREGELMDALDDEFATPEDQCLVEPRRLWPAYFLPHAIHAVAHKIAGREAYADDSSRWAELAAECIADLPAEVI